MVILLIARVQIWTIGFKCSRRFCQLYIWCYFEFNKSYLSFLLWLIYFQLYIKIHPHCHALNFVQCVLRQVKKKVKEDILNKLQICVGLTSCFWNTRLQVEIRECNSLLTFIAFKWIFNYKIFFFKNIIVPYMVHLVYDCFPHEYIKLEMAISHFLKSRSWVIFNSNVS